MFSERFQLDIAVTLHARIRMEERGIDDDTLFDLIETGEARYKDDVHLWLYKHYEGREDNLLCVAATIEKHLVVKTVMHHFEPL